MDDIEYIDFSEGEVIAETRIPMLDHGSAHWKGVVAEWVRMGKTRREAEAIANVMTDPRTLPQRRKRKKRR